MNRNSCSFSKEYPLHALVWMGDFRGLAALLSKNSTEANDKDDVLISDIDRQDPRGHSALMLAVIRGQFECAEALLQAGANADFTGPEPESWSVCDEATATGDPDLLSLCLKARAFQAPLSRAILIRELLQRLQDTPDFFVEMRWEFASWLPLVSRMCPSDVCQVYKSGAMVRIDTGLLGFDGNHFVKGQCSLIFRLTESAVILDHVDHDCQTVLRDVLPLMSEDCENASGLAWRAEKVNEAELASRLTSPILCSYLDTRRIEFEREKSGFFGWRSCRTEDVSGHSCRVFSASNIELVTIKRTEHLTEEDKARWKQRQSSSSASNPLESLLRTGHDNMVQRSAMQHCHASELQLQDYLDASVSLAARDVGRPQERVLSRQSFKASVWLSEAHPLSLQEQVLPVLDLLASRFSHFRQLRQFITQQLPAGFPLKVEIPLYRVVTARVTFSNLFASNKSVSGVTCVPREPSDAPAIPEEERAPLYACVVETFLFDPPENYSIIRTAERTSRHLQTIKPSSSSPAQQFNQERDLEEFYLQMALEQSLLKDVFEPSDVARIAKENVLIVDNVSLTQGNISMSYENDPQLAEALAASQEDAAAFVELSRREEEELELVLKLSLQEL